MSPRRAFVTFLALSFPLWTVAAEVKSSKALDSKTQTASAAKPKDTKPAVVKEVSQKNLANLQADLSKVESSVEITKTKIKSSKEVQFLPDLQFMLSELLIEKAHLLYTIKREKNPNTPSEEMDFSAEKRVLLEGLEAMETIEARYPSFQSLDRVLFYLAHEARQMNDKEKALKVYQHIVEKFSKSPFYIRSLVEIGNYFFDKKDFEYALKHFAKVLQQPVSPEHATAHYKMGWCESYLGHYLKAVMHFETALKSPPPVPDESDIDSKKSDFREEAIIASVWPFSELSEKDLQANNRFLKPVAYYKSISDNEVLYRKALKRLTTRLELKNRFKEAQEAATELFMSSDNLTEKLDGMESMYLRGRKIKLEYYQPSILKEVAATLYLLREKDRTKDLAKYEPLFRDMVTRTHRISLKLRRKEDLHGVVSAYEDYLRLYPNAKSRNVVLLDMAEASFVAQDYVIAGNTYFKVGQDLARHKKAQLKKVKEYFDSATQAFNEAFKISDHLTLLDRAQGRSGYRGLVDAYVKIYPTDPNVPALRFNYAKSLYDEQRFSESETSLKQYLQQYPKSKNALQAAILFLDSFYLQDDMKNLVIEGKQLLQMRDLDPAAKSKISAVIEQAQLKRVRSIAGDFTSKKYADKFLEFAKNSKGSSLGEPALYEAFASLRAGSDPRLYEIGQQYLATYGSNPRSKEVLSTMILTSMTTMDLSRAAGYLEAFGQKYSNEPGARDQMVQAAHIYEEIGQAESAVNSYMQLGDREKAVQVAADHARWSQLAELAGSLPGTRGLYYQGLALWRLGKSSEALDLLRRVSGDRGRDKSDRDMAAHAGVIVSEAEIEDFHKLGAGEAFSVPLLQKKVAQYQALNRNLQLILGLESPRWSVASLAMIGQLNYKFAAFLAHAKAPQGLPPAQFQQMIGAQIASYKKSAVEYFKKCLEIAEQNEILTASVQACRSGGAIAVNEKDDSVRKTELTAIKMDLPPSLRSGLLKNPRSMVFLNRTFLYFFNKQAYPAAQAVLYRIMEIAPDNADADANLGTVALFTNDVDMALASFKTALQKDSHHSKALRGIAGLYRRYQFKNQLQKILGRVRGTKPPSPPIHPWMKG